MQGAGGADAGKRVASIASMAKCLKTNLKLKQTKNTLGERDVSQAVKAGSASFATASSVLHTYLLPDGFWRPMSIICSSACARQRAKRSGSNLSLRGDIRRLFCKRRNERFMMMTDRASRLARLSGGACRRGCGPSRCAVPTALLSGSLRAASLTRRRGRPARLQAVGPVLTAHPTPATATSGPSAA